MSGTGKSKRGFASMDANRQKEIASKGGKAAHAKGTAHEFDSGEAREAGRKGGLAVSRNREHMAAIGRRGDYFTSVSVGPLFGKMLAGQFIEIWRGLGRPNDFVIVEQGAHHGEFATDVLEAQIA